MVLYRYIGIDPGVSGGIAVVNEDPVVIRAEKMPPTEHEIAQLLRSQWMQCGICYATIEKVSAMPGQGVSSTFKFGMSYGGLVMALAAIGIPFQRVPPVKWQKTMGCLSKGDKNVTKRRALELFPDMKPMTHAIADAVLLAEYCRRLRRGVGL